MEPIRSGGPHGNDHQQKHSGHLNHPLGKQKDRKGGSQQYGRGDDSHAENVQHDLLHQKGSRGNVRPESEKPKMRPLTDHYKLFSIEVGFRQKINFEFRMIYFGYISEEPQFRLNLG